MKDVIGPRTQKVEEPCLRVFERKIIRRIYGAVFTDGEWKRRSNKVIDELLVHEIIVGIRWLRIRWMGHFERMSEEGMHKMKLNVKIDSGRRRDRPRK